MKLLVLSGGRWGSYQVPDADPQPDDYKRSGMGFKAPDGYRASGGYSGSSLGFGRAPKSRASGDYSGSGGFQKAA